MSLGAAGGLAGAQRGRSSSRLPSVLAPGQRGRAGVPGSGIDGDVEGQERHRLTLAPGQGTFRSLPAPALPPRAAPAPAPKLIFTHRSISKSSASSRAQHNDLGAVAGTRLGAGAGGARSVTGQPRLLARLCQFAQLLLILALKCPLSVLLADGLHAGFRGSGQPKGFAGGFRAASQSSGSSRFPAGASSPPGLLPRSRRQSRWEIWAGDSPGKKKPGKTEAGLWSRSVSLTHTQPNAMLFWSWPCIINNNNCKILLPTTWI